MGFTDPFGGPVFNAIYNDFGGGFIEAYGDSSYMMEPVYFFDDPALYDNYIPPGEFVVAPSDNVYVAGKVDVKWPRQRPPAGLH